MERFGKLKENGRLTIIFFTHVKFILNLMAATRFKQVATVAWLHKNIPKQVFEAKPSVSCFHVVSRENENIEPKQASSCNIRKTFQHICGSAESYLANIYSDFIRLGFVFEFQRFFNSLHFLGRSGLESLLWPCSAIWDVDRPDVALCLFSFT